MVFLRALQLRTPTNHLSQVGGLIVQVNIANIASHFDVSLRGLCCVHDFRISLWSKAVTADHLAWYAFLLIFLHISVCLFFDFFIWYSISLSAQSLDDPQRRERQVLCLEVGVTVFVVFYVNRLWLASGKREPRKINLLISSAHDLDSEEIHG